MSKPAITITNHSSKSIVIAVVADSSVAEGDRKKTTTINPNDSYVFFMDRVEVLSWEKQK